jgi:hypothetical protein
MRYIPTLIITLIPLFPNSSFLEKLPLNAVRQQVIILCTASYIAASKELISQLFTKYKLFLFALKIPD